MTSSIESLRTCLLLCVLFAAFSMPQTVRAETILADDFTGVTFSGDTATIASWDTNNGVTASTSLTVVDDTGSASSYFDNNAGELDGDDSVWSTTDGWDVSFTLSLTPGNSISLTTLNLVSFAANNSGVHRTNSGAHTWTLTIVGDGAYGTQSASADADYNEGQSASASIDLSGMGDLVVGENYTVTLAVRQSAIKPGDLTYATLDSISLTGTLVTTAPEVNLSNSTVASNAAPGTLVGTLSDPTGSATTFALTNAPAGGSAADNDKFQITDGTNLRTRVWMSQYSNDVSIAGISNGVALATNSFAITLTAAGAPVFRVSAEVSNAPGDGDIVGKMIADNDEGVTFEIVSGRTDLFTQDASDNLLVTNEARWGGVGTTNWVTIRATNSSGTSDLSIGVAVISGARSPTLFRFL